MQNIKRLKHIFASIAWVLVGVYAVVVVLSHIPAVQRFVASEVSTALEQKLGTKVHIGNVNIGLLNRIVVDDVRLEDQQQRELLMCHRVSAKLDVLDIIMGRITISSAQIFGMKAQLVKADEKAPMNFQFILDSLASKDTTKKSDLNLRIASLVVRNSAVTYDRLDKPHNYGVVDFNHIAVDHISSHLMLNSLTNDSISLRLKKLSLAETNSGLNLNSLSFSAKASKIDAHVTDFNLVTDNSNVSLSADAYFSQNKVKAFNFVSNLSSISTKDIAMFYAPLKDLNRTIFLDANITGSEKAIRAKKLTISSSGHDLYLNTTARIQSAKNVIEDLKDYKRLAWKGNITAQVSQALATELTKTFNINSPILQRIGSVSYNATSQGARGSFKVDGLLKTTVGNVEHYVSYNGKKANIKLKTNTLRLGTLLASKVIGDVETTVALTADVDDLAKPRMRNVHADIDIPIAYLKGYQYRNIKAEMAQTGNDVNATISVADLNINAVINAEAQNAVALFDGKTSDVHNVSIDAKVNHINPNMLGFTKDYHSTTFSTNAKADIASLSHPLDNLDLWIGNFVMDAPTKRCHIDNLQLSSSTNAGGIRDVSLHSDFADAEAFGHFDLNTLKYSVTNIIAQKLPTLPGLPQYHTTDNNIRLSARITDSDILHDLLNLDIDVLSPVTLSGYIDDIAHKADLDIKNDSINYSGTRLDGTQLHLFTENDTLHIDANSSRRDDNGKHLSLAIQGKAANNDMQTSISWDNGNSDTFRGTLNATGKFFRNVAGESTASVKVEPSQIMIGDSLWHIRPATITYSANHLDVNNFCVEHGYQNIRINGLATKSAADSLTVTLQDINIAYILNLVNFHSVEFSGYASGTAVAKAVFSKPDAHAAIDVQDFRFENGRMGTLTALANYDNDLGQINIKGRCTDDNVTPDSDGLTEIDGYISLKRHYIDLGIEAENARLEFMHTYCDSFIDHLNAWASGKIHLVGDLSNINLVGDAVANGSVHISSLNCEYTLHNDSIHFIPDDMQMKHCVFYDKNGNEGWIAGALHHKSLSRMTFDLDVHAKHLLCYDFPTLNGEPYCGHVVGTGTCKIKGRAGEITFDVDAYPEETSELTYNVSAPDALQKQEFIQWRDVSEVKHDSVTAVQLNSEGQLERKVPDESFHTNIYLNFLVHATKESTLKLIMDERTGDIITLHGNGTLQASYYNKGAMQIFGNYEIEDGTYKMTIQQVITKNFEFMPGGTMSFAGNPMDAALNMQARYIVPSVPLSDLNIGNSFSNSTVRVNCLMNITGKAGQPQVEFDLQLPQASTDVQSMITSLMDTEQERNQHVLYLLSVGRFYAAENRNGTSTDSQSKTSVAMQSFISGTLSQQLNNILSNQIIKNHDWNFGANISPGDEGMNNADYEGLVSGRMLNNRLLLNGQFGYRDKANATSSFIGDFDVRYLLFPSGNLQVRVYNQTSDRYFTKSSLNTQGIGIVFKHDFDSPLPYFLRKDMKKKRKQASKDKTNNNASDTTNNNATSNNNKQ